MKAPNSIIAKQDYRSLSSSEREALRKRGIALIKSGVKQCDVAVLLGTSTSTVSHWHTSYKLEGAKEFIRKWREKQYNGVEKK